MPMPHRPARALAIALAVATLSAPAARAQEAAPGDLIPHAQDRPPNPPKSPSEAIAAMIVPDGFTVELVAAEPDLVNPVSMTFDERGRIWVTESLEYPRREPGPGRDRVKVLEDTDGDGVVDKTSIFCEGLNIPSGIAIGHGGVWVANSPDILFFPDADRNGVPDGPPEVVATGFGRDDTHELPNSLTWGPDGWLYGWNGVFNPARVKSNNGTTYNFTCAIWRIHPKTREFQIWCEGTSNPWGIAINEDGEFFASACVIEHLWHLVEGAYYIRQGGPYPPFTYPHGSIVDHTHQKAAYCGITWFDSDAYPEDYRDKLYMGNIHGNCINVDEVRRDGASYKASPLPDFLTANDSWFMPVSQKTGPDGCLYVLDWYDRYHCYQDANRDPEGIDRLKGRLYRIRYKDTPRRAGFDLAGESDQGLIKLLGSPNVYDRDIAQRLLTERLANGQTGQGTSEGLQTLVLDESARREARMHALWSLIGGGPLGSEFHRTLLGHADDVVRAWAVRAAGNQAAAGRPAPSGIPPLGLDPSPIVRLQASIATPKVWSPRPDAVALLMSHAAGGDDALITHVLWQLIAPRLDNAEAVDLVTDLASAMRLTGPTAATELWPRIIARAAATPRVDGARVARLAKIGLERFEGDDVARATLGRLTAAVRGNVLDGERLKALREALTETIRDAASDPKHPLRGDALTLAAAWGDPSAVDGLRAVAADASAANAARLAALETLIARQDNASLDLVRRLLGDANTPRPIRERVIPALGTFESDEVADIVLDAFPGFDGSLRYRAVELLTQRPAWSKALIAAIVRKHVDPSALNVNQIRRLQQSHDPEIVRAVREIWGTVREGRDEKRELVVGQMRNFLRNTPGDAVAGRGVFQKLCAQCHKIYDEGQEVGPEITLNGRNDWDQLLSNVFDPNLVIGQAYQAVNVATVDGRVLTGLLVEDSPARVVLRLQGGQEESIARGDVEEQSTSPVSLMPEAMEAQLTPQEIADLFAFLALDKPPEDPTARLLPGAPTALRRQSAGGAR